MNTPFIIGIAGGSASGKTVFCRALVEALSGHNVKVFEMDDYFKEQVPKSKAPITGKIYDDYQNPDGIDLQRMKNEHFAAKEDIVIVEGLFTLADEDIHRRLDLKLYIDCQADERIVRRLKRYQTEGGFDEDFLKNETFGWLSDYNLDLVRYRHDEYIEPSKWRADIILNGSMPSERALEMVKGYVLNMKRSKSR